MLVRLSEGLWGVCKILVGVQEYLRILLLVFHAYKLLQPRQTVIIRFHAAWIGIVWYARYVWIPYPASFLIAYFQSQVLLP